MQNNEPVTLSRDVDATVVPFGTRVTLEKGQRAYITQSLGGSYTVVVNGNMFRVEGSNADALGVALPVQEKPAAPERRGTPLNHSQLETEVWNQLRSCYDPEIPVNIVDLGLIYDCQVVPQPAASAHRVDVKMTLTAPGCGMGPMIQQDVQTKILSLEGVDEANIELVWDPPWNQAMMSEAARLQLGLM